MQLHCGLSAHFISSYLGLAAVSQYCSAVLSSFYFEIVKDSLYGDSLTSERRQAIAFTLSQVSRPGFHKLILLPMEPDLMCLQVLRVLTSCIAPIAPHLAEDAWSHWPTYPRSEATSFFETSWPVLVCARCRQAQTRGKS